MSIANPRLAWLEMHAAVCAVVVRAALRSGSVPLTIRAARIAGWVCRTRATAAECALAATLAADRLAHPTCLYRALTAYALLASRHATTTFHLGAAYDGRLTTHAWVSVDGRPLDLEAERYSLLWTSC